MKVSEQLITEILDQFESGTFDPLEVVADLQHTQPALSHFIFGRPDVLLNEAEAEIVTFASAVIWKCVRYEDKVIEAESLEAIEEEAWEIFESQSGKSFRDKLNPFFDRSDEEELLAFAEDMLTDDEEDELSAIGKEWIFITLVVMVDALCATGDEYKK